ncbi:hypothetical protein SUDANB70_00646 [Streptomyces sp. enrichment culture]
MRRRLSGTLLSVVLLAAAPVFAGCSSLDDGGGSGASSEPARTTGTPQKQVDQGESPQGGREEKSERDDLVDFGIDDRSQSGITDIWVTWTIKNNSTEKSNYTWEWEAVDANGTRVANSTEFVTDVQPGQTTTGEMFTTLKDADVILTVTEFDRTKSY